MASCYVVGVVAPCEKNRGLCALLWVFRSIAKKRFEPSNVALPWIFSTFPFSTFSTFSNLFQPFPTAFSNLFNLAHFFQPVTTFPNLFKQKVKWPQAQGRRNLFNLSNLFQWESFIFVRH